jgi:hypothetical protein
MVKEANEKPRGSSDYTGQQQQQQQQQKVSVMNMLLIYLFASMKLEKGQKY